MPQLCVNSEGEKKFMMNHFYRIVLILTAILLAETSGYAVEKVGVFFGSYGDIDDVETELRTLVRNTLTDPDVLPLPAWMRATIADAGWYIEKKGLLEEYAAIGGSSGMRARSKAQADAVAGVLRERGYDASGYAGFTMTFPYVAETLAQAQKDGIQKLFIYYQGAQYSKVTGYIVFRKVNEYLALHPEWKVEVIGIKSFTDDERFVDLIAKRIDRQFATSLSDYKPEDVCLFFPMHGNVERLVREGDPYVPQVMRVVERLKNRFSMSPLYIGFQNHDEIPLLKWTQPTTDNALSVVATDACRAVLINGLISFTVDSLETLYDHAVDEPKVLHEATMKSGRPEKYVVVEKMFNLDHDFVSFMADLAEETTRGQGDFVTLRSM